MNNLVWYIRYKWHVLRHEAGHIYRSPKTFMFLFIAFIGYAFLIGDKSLLIYFTIVFLIYYVYLDYIRGVPNKWKREMMIKDHNKKEMIRDGNSNRGSG